jgi:hypothetical protein
LILQPKILKIVDFYFCAIGPSESGEVKRFDLLSLHVDKWLELKACGKHFYRRSTKFELFRSGGIDTEE